MQTLCRIYDYDLYKYLMDEDKFLPQREVFEKYLFYRGEEFLGEWWTMNGEMAPNFDKLYKHLTKKQFEDMYDILFGFWVLDVVRTKKGIEFIKQDIEACNFGIEEIQTENEIYT